MARSYSVYDVFTDRKLAGNPLAVIFDGDNLSDEAMQAITREINLSETVFVQPSTNPAYAARLRIFTPGRELPLPAIRRSARRWRWPNGRTVLRRAISSRCLKKMSGRCAARCG